ncbi:hypothetical protein VYU27_010622, partial [Nannochloropsis oceanica]
MYLLQEASRKVAADPVKNHHAKKIREESDFYRHWLLPRARLYSKLRGWTFMPMVALEGFEPPTPALTPVSSERQEQGKAVTAAGSLPPSRMVTSAGAPV